MPFARVAIAAPLFLVSASANADSEVPLKLRGGFGDGVGIETVDGSFGMGIEPRAQARSIVEVPLESGEDVTAGFLIRRVRLTINAHAWDDLVTMKIQLAFAPLDQDPVAPYPVRDAYVTFAPVRDLHIRAGQMKVPAGRQRLVSSGNLQMVDRSIVTAELNLERDVGVQLLSEDLGGLDGLFGYNIGVFGGEGRNRLPSGFGFLYAARFAVRPVGGELGNDLDEVDFQRTKPRLQVATSFAFNHDSDRQRSTIGDVFETGPWADFVHAGADTSFKFAGLSMTGEVFLRKALEDTNEAVVDGTVVTDVARSGFGAFFQAGQLFADHFEISARVGALHRLGEVDSGLEPEKELGGAFSYYAQEHALKVQMDTFYLWDTWGEGAVESRLQLQIAP